MRKSRKNILFLTLFVCLFSLFFTMNYSSKVNAEEILDGIIASEDLNCKYLIVQKADGSEEETLVNLTEMLKLYGENGKIVLVSDDYDTDDCVVIATLDELEDSYGSTGQIVVTDGESEELVGSVGDLGGSCETNKIIVISKDEEEDPDQVRICTIGQLVMLS